MALWLGFFEASPFKSPIPQTRPGAIQIGNPFPFFGSPKKIFPPKPPLLCNGARKIPQPNFKQMGYKLGKRGGGPFGCPQKKRLAPPVGEIFPFFCLWEKKKFSNLFKKTPARGNLVW